MHTVAVRGRDVRVGAERAVPLRGRRFARAQRADATLGARLVAEERRVAVAASLLALQATERANEQVTVRPFARCTRVVKSR